MYNTNPYNQQPYAPFQPQYIQPAPAAPIRPGIAGKIVNNFSEITIQDIPTDCSPAFFIKSDLSEIQSRRWSDDGKVVPVTYRIIQADEAPTEDPLEKRIQELEERLAKIEKRRKTTEKEEAAE